MKLRAQSPDALRELARIRAEYEQQKAIQGKRAERKVQADREQPHFKLTPNDNPQGELLL